MQHPRFSAVPSLVGSFPHTEPQALVDGILSRFTALPVWPQLPARDWLESMYVQYSEGLPGVVVDRATERIYFSSADGFESQLEAFYEAVVGEDVDRFAIGRDYALGLHLFLESLPGLGAGRPRWLKGQVTGPFSFAMTVTDENKRALAYTPEFHEVAVQGMAMKARWLARTLRREAAEGALVVLDEPYLCSFGSAFVNVSRQDVIAAIDGAVDAIHSEDALAGLHCCGNTDWSLVLSTGLDVINFDAYEFFQGLSLYPVELEKFLRKGGTLVSAVSPIAPADRVRDDVEAMFFLVDVTMARLDRLSPLFESGVLKPDVGTVLPLEEARTAHQMLAGAPHNRGKIVLDLS